MKEERQPLTRTEAVSCIVAFTIFLAFISFWVVTWSSCIIEINSGPKPIKLQTEKPRTSSSWD